MTVTVKLITEQTTNQLVDSVNKAQADNWYPVCGVVYFNARYTQLMAQDTDITTPPACGYFIVDSEDGIDFANRVNKLVALNSGAVCLSSVQYVNARYIQAWGDDSLHNGGGGGKLPDFYSENVRLNQKFPQIITSPTAPWINLTSPNRHTEIIISADYDGNQMGDSDLSLSVAKDDWWLRSDSFVLAHEVNGTSMRMGDLSEPTARALLNVKHEAGSPAYASLDLDGTTVFGSTPTVMYLRPGATSLEMDASALRVKRGTNNLFSISDSGGAMTWNSMIRCVWDANGWNVSRDNGVAFSSRATYSVMIGPNGSRVEANNTGLALTSSDNPSQQSKLTMLNGEIKGFVTSSAEPFLVADANGTTLGYISNELKMNDGNNVTLNSVGADVILNALAGNVTFNAQGQSMSVGPAGLRYTVDGVDVIQSGSTASRSAPDLTIHRPGGGDMMLDMTANSARLQSSATSYVDVANAGASTKVGNTLLNVADNGMVTVSTGVDAYSPNIWLAQYTTGSGHNLPSNANDPQQQYLVIGGREWGTNSVRGIGFGYDRAATNWAPVFLGYRETNTADNNYGDLFFATRNVTTNTQPTERLRITSTGQITAAAGYTPVADHDLVTKKYVDNVSTTVGTYDASGTSAVAVVPGKDVYYSSVASAGGGLTMYAPTAGKPDVTVAAPSHAAIIINAPSGVLLRRGATTANLITIPPSTHCRFVALSATEWLVMPSGGAS